MTEALYGGIGHNQPPLDILLPEETQALRERAVDLVAMAEKLVVTDRESAGKAATLAKLIRDHAADVDKKRTERKEPFLTAGRTVDTHFNAIKELLVGSDAKARGAAFKLVNDKFESYQAEQDRIAAAERRRLEDLARQERLRAEAAEQAQREAAQAAQRAQEEADRRVRDAQEAARRAGDLAAQAEARRAQEAAERIRERNLAAEREAKLESDIAAETANNRAAELEKKAIETVAPTVVSSLGVRAARRMVKTPVITDFKVALAHAVKVDKATIEAAVLDVYERQVRAKVESLPGAEIKETPATTFR